MVRSRTIKVLFALLIAMTVGALALMVLQTNPIRPAAQFAAIADANQPGPAEAVFDTAIPLQPTKWRNIVVHGSQAERRNVADQSHFVIGESGAVVVTALWKQQVSGQHVWAAGRDWNTDSIGLCLMGDLSQRAPSSRQYRALLLLVRTLQEQFNVSADHVYLYRHLNVRTRSPGDAFPADHFSARLRRPQN